VCASWSIPNVGLVVIEIVASYCWSNGFE
jgi:hypothetical protein